MKKIEVYIPEDIDTKNNAFSYCFSYLKNLISWDKDFNGVLKPLGDKELISMDNLLKYLNERFLTNYTLEDLSYHIREYERQSWETIRPVKKYKQISKTKVYLVDDLDGFKLYMLNKNK